MKKIFSVIAGLVLALSMAAISSVAFADPENGDSPNAVRLANLGEPGQDYVDGQVIVCVKGGKAALDAALGFVQMPAPNSDGGDQNILMSFEAYEPDVDCAVAMGNSDFEAYLRAQKDERQLLKLNATKDKYEIVLVSTNGMDVPDYIAWLESLDCVAFAEPNYVCVASLGLADAQNEPYYPYEWYLSKNNIPVNFDTDVEAVYSDPSFDSSHEVVVAVMDSGVDYTHPDLVESMWDDGLNYPTLTAMGGGKYGINTSGDEMPTTDPMDTTVGHGTHCASTIASTWGNNEGIAGVNGKAKIMACRWMSNSGIMSNALKGYAYIIEAKKQGVPIVAVNNSWGNSVSTFLTSPLVTMLVNLAGEEGIVSCFAAGNSSLNHDSYTNQSLNSPYILTVGAMNSKGGKAWFSDFGKRSVDVFAPGTQILAATSLQATATVMPAMYLPWIDVDKDKQGTFLFEGFEGSADKVQVSSLTDDPAQPKTGGYASASARMLDFSGLDVGDEVGFQIKIPLNTPENPEGVTVPESEKYYLAFEAGISGFDICTSPLVSSPIMQMEYLDAAGEWKTPSEAARWREIDGNWSVSSSLLPDFQTMVDAAKTRGDNCITMRFSGMIAGITGTPVLYIDNVGLGTKTSKYYYSDGTSMATPCTTGIVSLVAGSRAAIPANGEAARDVIARVKGSVLRTGLLDDSCITQGCVQADAVFASDSGMNPVPDSVIMNGGTTATISGRFFGSGGSVYIDGIEAAVASWADEAITVQIPAGISYGLKEYLVVRADGKEGRDFGVFSNERDYVDLPIGATVYSGLNGYEVNTEDLIPLRMAATDDGLLVELGDVDGAVAALQFYSFSTGEWVDVPYPDGFNPLAVAFECLSAMTAGKNEIYLLADRLTDDAKINACLLTLDTSTLEWVSVTSLPNLYQGSELLALDKDGRLLTALGMSATDTCVYQLYPDTGLCGLPLSTMPSSLATSSGGTLMVSGDTQIAAGANGGVIARALESYTGEKGVPCSEPVVFNGLDEWVSSETSFFNNLGESYTDPEQTTPGLDKAQSLLAAYGALDGGFIMAGPSRGIDTTDMVDTWVYDVASDSYTPLDARVDGARLSSQVGTTHGNTFFVMGNSAVDHKLIFRSLDLSKEGLSCTDATVNAQRSDGSSLVTAVGSTWLDGEKGGYYVVGSDGVLTHEGASESNYQVAYDNATNKVVLKDVSFEGIQEGRSALGRAALYSRKDLTVEVLGTNLLSGPAKGKSINIAQEMAGIWCDQSVTFIGDGDLTLKSGGTGFNNRGIIAKGDIVFAGTGSINCVGQHIEHALFESSGGSDISMIGICSKGTVEVRAGTVFAMADGYTPSFGSTTIPYDMIATGLDAQALATGGGAVLVASTGDLLTLKGGSTVGIDTDAAPAYALSTVYSTHGTLSVKPQSGTASSNLTGLTGEELEEALTYLFFNRGLNPTQMRALLAGDLAELEKLLDMNSLNALNGTQRAYSQPPVAVDGFNAVAWYGATEKEALAGGAKTLEELSAHLDSSYTQVAAYKNPSPIPDPVPDPPDPKPIPNPSHPDASHLVSTGDAMTIVPIVVIAVAAAVVAGIALFLAKRKRK